MCVLRFAFGLGLERTGMRTEKLVCVCICVCGCVGVCSPKYRTSSKTKEKKKGAVKPVKHKKKVY